MSAAAARGIVQYLADVGLADIDVDLRRDWLPDAPDCVVAVMGMGGTPSYAMEGSAGSVEGQVQIQVRAGVTDYLAAEDRSLRIMWALDLLDAYKPSPPGDEWVYEINSVMATDAPMLLERDGNERPIVLTVYDVSYLPRVGAVHG